MNGGRVVFRGVGGLVALGIGLLILIPVGLVVAVVSLPVLIILGVGAAAFLAAGLPLAVAGLLALLATVAVVVLLKGAVAFGLFALKVILFAMLLSWLARKFFGFGGHRRSREAALVGMPVADIAAPSGRVRDKYDIAAERELDEELGL